MYENITYEDFIQNIKSDVFPERGTEELGTCPITPVLNMLQGKWTSHVLFQLCKYGTLRFGQLKKVLPNITNTMLASTLREMETHGLIIRMQYNEIPPHVDYSLTEKGRDLMPLFYIIFKWGIKYNL